MGCFENPIVVSGYILCNVLILSSVIFSIVYWNNSLSSVDVGMVGRTTLKPRVSFVLIILSLCSLLMMIASKLPPSQQTGITTIRLPKHPVFLHSSYPYPITSPLAPPDTSHTFSHLYPPRIVFTSSFLSHNFFSSWPKIFIEIFPTTFLIL